MLRTVASSLAIIANPVLA
jgi:hypothetical protein